MNIKHKIWLDHIRKISHKFIEDNFSSEESLFDSFWQAFCFKTESIFKADPSGQLIIDIKSNIVTDISFAKDCAIDMVTPIVLATVAETMRQVSVKKHSLEQLATLVSKAAAKFGAEPSLTACLEGSLPKLCIDILTCDPNAEQATVSKSPQSQYRIFVNGGTEIVSSIDEYRKDISKYLFWIDLDNKPDKSAPRLDPMAINLLKYLVKNIGIRNSITDILRKVYEDTPSNISKSDKEKIAQHLSQLNKYGKEQFLRYTFSDWRNKGLGLKESFFDKYFLFIRLVQSSE